MYIIVRGKERNLRTLKGKNVSEFSRNLESIGWPSEFANKEVEDRAKFIESKEGRPLAKGDLKKIAREIKDVNCGCPNKCSDKKETNNMRFYKNGMPRD